jgi:hypothetical protein
MDTRRAAGALLIRAWVDEGRLKARLMRLVDGDTETLTVVGAGALLAAVTHWIDLLAPPGGIEQDGE